MLSTVPSYYYKYLLKCLLWFQDSIANSGQLTITPTDYKSRNNYLTSDTRFGFIKIQLIPTDSSQSINGVGAAAAP